MKRFDQINMIPFIDIMLVLLAIVLKKIILFQKLQFGFHWALPQIKKAVVRQLICAVEAKILKAY